MTADTLQKRHFRFGWWTLCLFAAGGLVLEAFHGLKLGGYLEAAYATRRLMWTLGHAHGTLLALVHIAFAATLPAIGMSDPARRWASGSLTAASVLLPGGFIIAGIFIYDGDPGLGIFLVPIGAVALLVGVSLTATAASKS